MPSISALTPDALVSTDADRSQVLVAVSTNRMLFSFTRICLSKVRHVCHISRMPMIALMYEHSLCALPVLVWELTVDVIHTITWLCWVVGHLVWLGASSSRRRQSCMEAAARCWV